MKNTTFIESLGQTHPARASGRTKPKTPTARLGQRLFSGAPVLLPLLALALLGFSNRAAANPFAATTLNPSSQTVNVGVPCSVDVVFAVPAGGYTAYGIQAWINFDPTKVQVVSVTTGNSSSFTTVFANQIDNTNGKLTYGATGGNVSGATFTVATIVFTPIAAGTSPVSFGNVNEYIVGYGPFGVNGLAVGGSITVNAPPPLFFSDSLTGPTSPNLTIPTAKYSYISSGLQRTESDNDTDRPIVATRANSYLTANDFTAEVTVLIADNDISYFGVGIGDMDSSYNNEPGHAFYFRAHNNFVNGGGGYYGIQAAVRSTTGIFLDNHEIGQYTPGSAVTLRIVRAGDNITMSIVGGGSVTYSLSAYQSALDLTISNTKVFFGNTSFGSVFSDLKIYPTPPPVVTSATISQGYGTPFSYQISATGSPTSYTATGLPAGLSIDASTGVISGTLPNTVGSSTIALSASNAGGSGTGTLTLTIFDNVPPVLTVPLNIVTEATSAAGALVTFTASAKDFIDGSVPVTLDHTSGSIFPLGTTLVTATASDASGNKAMGFFNVTVQDTTPPAIAPVANITAEATSPSGAVVTFTASATDLVDGNVTVNASRTSGSTFPLGTTTVTLTATDAHGNTTTSSFTVTVRDTTPPVIASVTPSTATLWPPNHNLVPITLNVSATDAVGVTSLRIVSVTSNEPDNGLGDGDTANDIVFTTNPVTVNGTAVTGGLTLSLRAERSGTGNGRVYTITVQASDLAGNASTKTVTVSVPKSQAR